MKNEQLTKGMYKRVIDHYYMSKDEMPFVPREEGRLMEDPLTEAEKIFIEKALPGFIELMNEGFLTRMIDYQGNFFLVLLRPPQLERGENDVEQNQQKRVESVRRLVTNTLERTA